VLQAGVLEDNTRQHEKRVAALEAACKRHEDDIEFQDAEMASLKEAVAAQVDELVRRCAP
jgi:hypothetical protein